VLGLGGDHFVAGPLIRAAAKTHGPLALVHLDAHSDNWEVKEVEHHGNFLAGLVEEGLVDPARSIQVGLRTPQPEGAGFHTLDMDWLSDHGMEEAAKAVKERVGTSKAYLTLDIDVLDPSCAPGTGTPVAGGLLTREARRLLRGLAGLEFVGADVVEVSPPYDTQQITAIAGATLAVDLLYLLSHARL
jgi:agmatinase